MNQVDFQRLLFRSAMLAMACDGEIHADEINEMELAFKNTHLFKELSFDIELTLFINELDEDKGGTVNGYLEEIQAQSLDPVQKLQVLEIILRIIYADNRVHENEVRFAKIVKVKLDILDEIVFKRFGNIDFLSSIHNESKNVISHQDLIDSVVVPKLDATAHIISSNLEEVDAK